METYKIFYALIEISLNNGFKFEQPTKQIVRLRPGEDQDEMLKNWIANEVAMTEKNLKCENVKLNVGLQGVVDQEEDLPDLKNRWED